MPYKASLGRYDGTISYFSFRYDRKYNLLFLIKEPAEKPPNIHKTNNAMSNPNEYRFAQGSSSNLPVNSYPVTQHPPILGPPSNVRIYSINLVSLPELSSFNGKFHSDSFKVLFE